MGRRPSPEPLGVFQLRVPVALRDRFVEAARRRDQTAAQVLRAYMRDYAAKVEAELRAKAESDAQ